MSRPDLRARYAAERDKRLRPDGNDQYVEPTGRFASLLDDPYTEPFDREPVVEDLTVLLIGAGFAGLVHAARLVEAGITDLRLVDKAGDVGGVWYWNRYPGAHCDTAAMIYLPLLEETGTVPSRKYVPAPEILAHAQRIATTFDLYDRALLSTGITDVTWDADTSRWIVRTDRDDVLRARYVITGTGPLSRPKLPAIEGLDTFAGPAFHTSRWDYAVTGGGPDGSPMTALADKRVGIIGTGATAVQAIRRVAESAGELFVFQRTPSSVDERGNRDSTPSGSLRSDRAGNGSGSSTSPRSRPVASPTRTSSRTAGPTSPAGSAMRSSRPWATARSSPPRRSPRPSVRPTT